LTSGPLKKKKKELLKIALLKEILLSITGKINNKPSGGVDRCYPYLKQSVF
jgi:hypothetical protein